MILGDFGLVVVVAGVPLPETWGAEPDCVWVPATRGQEFSLLLTNAGTAEALAIPSIDGASVLDGKPASDESPGYIVPARGDVSIPEWQIDRGTVARFEFGMAAKGYARQLGHSRADVGIIGAAFFRKRAPTPEELWQQRRSAALAGLASEIAADVAACQAFEPTAACPSLGEYVRAMAPRRLALWQEAANLGDPDGATFVAVCRPSGRALPATPTVRQRRWRRWRSGNRWPGTSWRGATRRTRA